MDERIAALPVTYLSRQKAVLASAVGARLPAEVRERHRSYLAALQNEDGGFSGREGESDLYYTAFALWGLSLVSGISEELGRKASQFLRESWQRPSHLVDFFSLFHGYRLLLDAVGDEHLMPPELRGHDWGEMVVSALGTCRTPDGGYARTPGQKSGSTYATFLTVLCHEELGKPLPKPEEVLCFLKSRRRDDGGYVELAPMRRSGTNPTSAAAAVFQVLEPFPSEERAQRDSEIGAFIASLQGVEGGLRANTVVPVSDLLSTFTGMWTLHTLKSFGGIDIPKARRYVASLEQSEGGFVAGIWDAITDVEYTFYGLASLALLSEE